ncbi:MAG: PIN domain-containing protein [Snowella sp.]|nr:PIN domain-containing protein [Snowella sp.]
MIYLDTHIVVWLYGGLTERFTNLAIALLNEHDLYISPMVRLELQYLYEIERVSVPADSIILDLGDRVGLRICEKDFNQVVGYGLGLSWTRDPFDRLIVAQAMITENILLTKDVKILENYAKAMWE